MSTPGLVAAARWAGLLEGDPRLTLALAAAAGGGVWLFLRGFRSWRHMRLVQDTPTSKVRSLALGRVEVHGRAEEKAPLQAPFTGLPCVWYRWKIEEEVRSNRRRTWRTLEQGDSDAWAFYVEDETGRVLVDPRGARVDLPTDLQAVNPPLAGPIGAFLLQRGIEPRTFFGFRRKLRFTEWHISPGDDVYVLGVAQERGGLALERRRRIADKLAALKADPEAMAHLDVDGDGSVSAQEWEVARRLAVQEVELAGYEDRVVIAADEHGATPFYVSDRDEKEVVRRHRVGSALGVFGGAALALGGLAGILHRIGLL